MHRIALLLLMLSVSGCRSTTGDATTITILHFSDYHSHAVPFYVDDQHGSAGIARAIQYIKPLSEREDVLVFNGGDTMNLGAPAWSDKYRCIEWSWWNGIIDAMAFGNHDADYGPDVFSRCRETIDYPILGANVVDARDEPLFAPRGKPYVVFERHGIRIGAFALAGSDFATLIRDGTTPVEGVRFTDREQSAKDTVRRLREIEGVHAVVLIGHASTEEDVGLARAVPGIDLILGTHSHRLQPLEIIDGTSTRMISPGQYLGNVSRVELTFRDGELVDIDGLLVPMAPHLREHPETAARVAALQRELELDPEYAPLFTKIAEIDRPLSNAAIEEEQTPFGSFVMEAVRAAADADVALSTSSSFRGALPSGPILETDLLGALPYDNQVVRLHLSGRELRVLFERVSSLRGTDSFAQIAGATLRFGPDGRLLEATVRDQPLDPTRRYIVATTDYMARLAPRYREIFAGSEVEETGLFVRDIVREALAQRSF